MSITDPQGRRKRSNLGETMGKKVPGPWIEHGTSRNREVSCELQSVALPAELPRQYCSFQLYLLYTLQSAEGFIWYTPCSANSHLLGPPGGHQSASMSGAGPRENVFATRMALTNMKLRLKSAETGHSLLAKKRDALTTRFRAILKKVDEVRPVHHADSLPWLIENPSQAKRKMGRVMQLASFSMAEVSYATGDIAYLVQEQAKLATFRVKATQENVSGVLLPAFEADRVSGSGILPYCLHLLCR